MSWKVAAEAKEQVMMLVVQSSLRFADTYPEHEKAAIVLGARIGQLNLTAAPARETTTAPSAITSIWPMARPSPTGSCRWTSVDGSSTPSVPSRA